MNMTTLLLFLDIETNGLNPITDEIIEIAGILCSWDGTKARIISTFDQTIANIQPIDPIVTKITGLTDQFLASSPRAFAVRDKWANWLEGQIQECGELSELIIIGHSLIEFDAKFLKSQSWYLPEKAKYFDTFYLSKILLPQLSAVNLESLTVNLELNPEVLIKSGTLPIDKIVPHRALYDTACCLDLWLKLLGFIRLYELSESDKKLLVENFVGVKIYDLHSTTARPSPILSQLQTSPEPQLISWAGETLGLSVAKQINQQGQAELLHIQTSLAKIQPDNSNPKWLQIYLQLRLMIQAKLQYNWTVHLHGQKSDHSYIQNIWQSIQSSSSKTKPNNPKAQTPTLENLIWQVDEIANRTVNMQEMVWLIEIVEGFSNPPELKLTITKLFNSYDFWVISLNQFWVKSQHYYNPGSMPINQEIIYNKLASLCENIEEARIQITSYLNTYTKSDIDTNSSLLGLSWLNNWLTNNPIDYNQPARLSQIRESIKIAYTKEDFNLIRSISQLLLDQTVQIPTYLTAKQVESLIGLYQLDPIKAVILERINYLYKSSKLPVAGQLPVEYDTPIRWIDGYLSQIEDEYDDYLNNRRQGRPRIWLCNTNSTLTKVANILEKIATDRNSYNIVGLTGSITKISSKIRSGFDGIAVIKQTDIYMLKNLTEIDWDSISIIGNYHSFVSPVFDYINQSINENKKLQLTQLQNNSLKNQLIVAIQK